MIMIKLHLQDKRYYRYKTIHSFYSSMYVNIQNTLRGKLKISMHLSQISDLLKNLQVIMEENLPANAGDTGNMGSINLHHSGGGNGIHRITCKNSIVA